MSDTRRYASVPPLTLASDLSSSGTLVKTQTAVDWDGNALSTSSFNTDYIPATLINDARSKIEFILIDATTLANLTTTGATIYKRGLPFHATGDDSTDETESSTRKEFWTQGETKLLIGANPPWMYGQLANRKNDETITGLWTFTLATRPKLTSDANASTDTEFVTLGQLNRTALGTTYADRLVVAGTAGETITIGQLLYFKASDARWWKADADATATSDDVILGIAQGAGAAAGAITGGVLLRGLDPNQSGLTAGTTYYVSGTAGAISSTPGTNNVSVGVAASTTGLLFFPRFDSFITPATKALVEAITASAAELNVLDGFTGTTGNLNDVVSYYLGLPTANTWTAGENLTEDDVVKIQNYAGAGEKLYKLQGTVTKQTIPQALANGGTAVFLDSTTILIAESNTGDTSLDVRAYTINATTGALSLIHSLTIGSFFSANADVKLKSARISSTKAIFLGEGSAGANKVVAVQLSGGTLTNGSVVNTSGTGTPLGIWNVDGVITFAMIKSAGADTCILQTFSESGLVVTSVDSDSFTSFGNAASPSGASASKIDDNTYVASGNNAATDLNFAIASVDNAGSITKGTVEAIATDKFALVAGYNVGSNLNFVMLIDDTEFRRYSVSGTTATLEATTSSSLSITEDGDGMYAFQKSALVFNGALEVILDMGALTTRTLPSAFIEVGSTGRFFVPSTADGRYILASLDDELQIGSFDWGEADGVIAETVTAGNTTELLKTSYEIIGTLSGLTRGRQYNLTQGGGVSANSTNSAFPIYTAIDATRAIISDVL